MVEPWIAPISFIFGGREIRWMVQATGAEVVQEPMDQSYGRDCAFRDPAGNMIRIFQSPD